MNVVISVAKTALKGVSYYNPLKATDGYTLFCPYGHCAFSGAYTNVWLIDMKGHIVHRWRMPSQPAQHGILLPSGYLLYPAQTRTPAELGVPPVSSFSGFGGEILELDWDGNVVWKAETPYQSHDFLVLPNHHIMYPTYADPRGILPHEFAIKWKGGIPGTEPGGKIYNDIICEIDENGKKVWEWNSYEHLDPEIDALCPLEDRSQFWHINSLWLCKDGSILVSGRHMSEVIKIEYPSGKVIARYGRGKISHQHDASELNNGNILVFDNGAHRHGYGPSYSRVVEIDPSTDEVVWEYKANLPSDFYSAVCGGSERLPNGNTVICDSVRGRIFEVTYDGELVWEYLNPFMTLREDVGLYGGKIFRAHRYPPDYPAFKGRDLDPARYPWENKLFGPDAFKMDFTPCIF